ncbi:uncharacterized protein BX664DRAFT_315468 [Halteromyces radiatus]|uniref:uncharacterized protein n=1 Tax=Halteromyces radiatus TaxID=101107 RepID=UPI002221154D|nr:uncharacterized protein BX664DRAFT_315468 [Halteromyces radiatus]KAI8086261.1 hypothetical protein BX664DRAFT_315468 [Halteromyces radiatus]
MSSQQLCVITNVDSLVGYALAFYFLKEQQHGSLRLLCRNKEGLEELAKMGGEIRQVDYNREDQVRDCFKNVKAGILIPEHDSHRIQQAENVMKAAKNENVHHLCMMSLVGVDHVDQNESEKFKNLLQYRHLEQKIKEIMGNQEQWSIVRLSAPNQLFYLMAPLLESHRVLRLPIKKDQKWSPVDLNDVVEAIFKLAKENQQQGLFYGRNRKELYQFTPRQVLSMEELVRQISQGLVHEAEEIKYEQVGRDEIRKYLEQMRNDKRFKERPKSDHTIGRQDKPYTFPLGRYMNDDCIETLLEIWELANQGRMDIHTDDLKQILGRDPQDIRSYFEQNRGNFDSLR